MLQRVFRQLNKCNENKCLCDKFNYKASQASDLEKYIKSIHEVVKYPCDQCNNKGEF